MPAKPDRRVRRTRRLLYEALISLIPEKGYDRITVQDVLDRADVGRSTFYAHFGDKDDLLVSGFDELRQELRREFDSYGAAHAAGDPADDLASPALALFEHVEQHQRVYLALTGKRGGDIVHRHLHRLVGDLLREHLEPHLAAAETDVPADVIVEFYVSSLLGLLTWWLDQGLPHSPSRIDQMYQRLLTPGLRILLGQSQLVDSPQR